MQEVAEEEAEEEVVEQQALCTLCGENVKALAAMATRQFHSPH